MQFDKEIKTRIKKSNSYKYFVKKWPIQVYFQIRFQEIVLKLEEDLLNFNELTEPNDDDLDKNNFYLKMSQTLIQQIEYNWLESKCFLKSLLSNFWKLHLQLVSRYSYYFIQLFQQKIALLDVEQSQLIKEEQETINKSENESEINKSNDIKFSVLLLFDAHKLQTLKVY